MSPYFAHIDAAGRVLGFYVDGLHSSIPDGAIPISAEMHAAWIADTAHQRWDAESAALVPCAPPPPPAPVPDISARQLRLWLLAHGIALASVDAAIAALPEADRDAAQVEWEYATVHQRAHPLIMQLAPAIGLTTPEAIDDAFRAAALL